MRLLLRRRLISIRSRAGIVIRVQVQRHGSLSVHEKLGRIKKGASSVGTTHFERRQTGKLLRFLVAIAGMIVFAGGSRISAQDKSIPEIGPIPDGRVRDRTPDRI